jgi:hypothetical protein
MKELFLGAKITLSAPPYQACTGETLA